MIQLFKDACEDFMLERMWKKVEMMPAGIGCSIPTNPVPSYLVPTYLGGLVSRKPCVVFEVEGIKPFVLYRATGDDFWELTTVLRAKYIGVRLVNVPMRLFAFERVHGKECILTRCTEAHVEDLFWDQQEITYT